MIFAGNFNCPSVVAQTTPPAFVASGRRACAVTLALAFALHAPALFAQATRTVPGGYDPCNNPNAYKLPECQRPIVSAPRPALPTKVPAGMPAGAAGATAAQLLEQGNARYDARDFRGAMALYQRAAALGDPRAMSIIGKMYHYGEGVTRDPKQAAQWYERGAAGGARSAQFALAGMLEEGDDIPRNVPRAAKLYEQSARQGFPDAQFALGISYEFGQGVPRNRKTATYWLDQAAAQGDGRANWFSSWLKSSATPQFNNPDRLRDYINAKVDARMLAQMNVGGTMCSTAPWVCSRERAERLWQSEYHPPNTPNPFRN